ncbi:MAG: hypothetical protein CMI52_03000 [Parcubacteria group bacterium]|nr:hypothetical protein [Parcubacteria group bacterium]|tara:strand:- start:268 stop:600 length:333 start_codon:yes stop_codon:yes gene_type:complete
MKIRFLCGVYSRDFEAEGAKLDFVGQFLSDAVELEIRHINPMIHRINHNNLKGRLDNKTDVPTLLSGEFGNHEADIARGCDLGIKIFNESGVVFRVIQVLLEHSSAHEES